MSRYQIAENLVELAKSFRLHPMKNGDTLKGIKQRIHIIHLHCRKREAVDKDLWQFPGTTAVMRTEVMKVKGNKRGETEKGKMLRRNI